MADSTAASENVTTITDIKASSSALDRSLDAIIADKASKHTKDKKKKKTKALGGKLSKKTKKAASSEMSLNPADLLDRSLGDIIKEKKILSKKNKEKVEPTIILQPPKTKKSGTEKQSFTNKSSDAHFRSLNPVVYDPDAPKISAVKLCYSDDLLMPPPVKSKKLMLGKLKSNSGGTH
jgi:hypothetical protein